jgi:hypothetical protein
MAFKPFFPPSAEITSQLIRRMGQRRALTLLEEAGATPSEPGDEVETSDELLTSIVEALSSEPESDPAADWQDQRWLSEVIYHFLGFQAGRARRGGRNEFSSTDIVEGMRDGLGLYEESDLPFLEQLVEEFFFWLGEQNGTYTAGWGVIARDDYDPNVFRLEPLTKPASLEALREQCRTTTV